MGREKGAREGEGAGGGAYGKDKVCPPCRSIRHGWQSSLYNAAERTVPKVLQSIHRAYVCVNVSRLLVDLANDCSIVEL